ncbi:DUF506 family protein [Senna tora]|uniref:DUF506 family protein n=1 Tax=Senna tora TaxID=362788 RepID=A0A834SHR6_9FABA|nr:DUF506 family protein [Senna tora]
MARKFPVRFQRVAAAFDADVARVTTRLCESSGSEHSPESSLDLTDLVKSFMERNEGEDDEAKVIRGRGDITGNEEDELEIDDDQYCKNRQMLQSLLLGDLNEGVVDQDERIRNVKKIRGEVEIAYRLDEDMSSPEFKRRLMTRLRRRGFDAGLCKSKWDKNGRFPGGDYEYMDVNIGGERYIIEVSLSAEFQIARPTDQYLSLLHVLPLIYVGKVEELKKVVRIMCNAIKESMKSTELDVPPWRRNGYMQAKWLSSYRRTTNQVSTRKPSLDLTSQAFSATRSFGFVARPVRAYRDEYVSKIGFRVGHLTEVLET